DRRRRRLRAVSRICAHFTRASCGAISAPYTCSASPTPPALANAFEYSFVRYERHTPVAWLPPNGPSPSILVIIWLNIELRNTASKSSAAARALALVIAPALRVIALGKGPMP